MSRRPPASEPAAIDVYRAPAEPPSPAVRPARTGIELVLFDVALAPVSLNMVTFGLQFVLPSGSDARAALSWSRLLLIAGALARTAGIARFVRAPGGRQLTRGLRIALVTSAGAVLLATAIWVLLRLGDPTQLVRGIGATGGMIGNLVARPTFMVLMAIGCRNILGPGAHRWLIRTTIMATLSTAALGIVDLAQPYFVPLPASDETPWIDTALWIASSATGLTAWFAASLLLWRLRTHLLRAPTTT